MAQFTDNDINEAKRRVMDMRSKASQYTAPQNKQVSTNNEYEKKDISTDITEDEEDKSFLIILALIMILSHENADNKLLLALLYLLL